MHSYQLELHTQLTRITEQAHDILRHIATFGNNSSQSQGGVEAENEEQNKATEDDKGEISFGEELKEIFESNSETGDGKRKLSSEQDVFDIQASGVNVDLSEEKQLEYKRILENIVQDVQSSLGRFS